MKSIKETSFKRTVNLAIAATAWLCSCFFAIGSNNVANDGPAAVTGPKVAMRLLSSGQTGSPESGFTPPAPSDIQFVALMGGDLHVQKSAGETIRFPLLIDRVFGDVNKLSGCGAMPSSVVLRMRVWDVDSDYSGDTPEEDHVYVNGTFVGILSGQNQIWTENNFPIPISLLNLKEDENGTGLNTVEIRVAVAGGGWVTKVDWASIYIPAPPPVVIAHGIRDSAEGMQELEEAINNLGLPTYVFSFNNNGNNGIKDGARQLGSEVAVAKAKFGVEHVNIVAHSIGGLKAREYAENANDVAKVLQIATPNAGAPAADLSIYGTLFDILTQRKFDKVLKKLFGISVYDGALHDLSPSYMAKYNNDKSHHLNSSVYYRVVAGAVNTRFDSTLFALGSKTYGHGEWYNGVIVRGDGIVPLESAHTYIGPYDSSPVSGSESVASHTGLVTAGARNVVAKYLKGDLLEQKVTGQLNDPVKMAASRSCRSTATPSFFSRPIYTESGIINLSSSMTTITPFEITKGNDTSIWLTLDDCDDFDVELTSPTGIRYGTSSNGIFISKEGGNAFIDLTSPEVGQWQLAITARAASSAVTQVPYVVDINESNAGIQINAWLDSDNVKAGEPFQISVRPTIDGNQVTGKVYANIRHCQDTQNLPMPKILFNSGNGVYTGTLTTTVAGEYDIAVSVEAQSPSTFTRGTVLSGVAYSSSSAFNGNATFTVNDTDNNGLYENLVASFGVDISRSGTYRVLATLIDTENGTTIAEAWTTNTYCTTGAITLNVNFAGNKLYSYGECGGYAISEVRLMEIGDTYDAIIDTKANVVTTTNYSFNQFEHVTLSIKEGGHDVAVDMDGNGTNDCIIAIVPLSIESMADGDYQWSASLMTTNGAMLAVDSGNVSLSATRENGNTIPMTFSVDYIKANEISGPFVIGSILLWNENTEKYIALEGRSSTKNDYPISTWNTATTGYGATVLFVNAAQEDDSGDGKSWRTAKKTIQGAIDCADTTATVFVYDGRYAPFSNSKSIFITSVNGADKVFVDGSLTWGDGVTNRCVTISNSGASIRGFTLENGIADCGGGLYLRGSAKDCVISNCVASSNGGGLYMYDGDCFATNCIVKDCIAASSGGGVFGPGLAINCLVTGNRAEKGGGLYGNKAYNCIISNNIADYGGGTYDGVMNNCTIVGNVGMITAGGSFGYTNIYYVAPHIGIIIVGSSSEPRPSGWFTNQCGKVCNSIVWGNSSPISNDLYNVEAVYSCASNCSMIDGNIRNDPMLYVCSDGRIMIRVNSPCIDTGVNSNIVTMLDYCGNGRVQNGIVDMGAIEWQGYKSVNGNFVWQSGGDGAWDIDYDQDVAAQGCFVSGDISHSQQTWIETTVKGCGTISFDWKVSSEARFDTLSIYVDGVRKKYISGITDWTSVTIPIEALATHTIRWVYAKSASGTSGEDRGWLDNVKWIPDVERNAMSLIVNSEFGNPSPSAGSNIFAWGDEVQLSVASSFELENVRGVCKGWSGTGSVPISGTETNLTFTIETPSSITWNWDLEYLIRVTATAYGIVDIESAWVKDKQCITITATPNESCGGFRWAGDVEGAAINGYAITIPANRAKNIKAEFLPPSYGVALGITGVELSSGGDSTWSIDYSESANGDGSSCRSGVIDGQGVSYIEMTVTGPGTLSFLWKLAVGFSVAGIDLVIDGDIVDGLMDETDWIPRSFPISSGTHTVRWEFYRDGSTPGDYACIDNVTWTGSVPTPGVAFKEVWIEGDTNWVAEVDSEERQYRLVGKTQTDYIYLLNADKWQMENWDCSGSASFEDYYSLSRDGLLSMKSCGCTGQGVLMATYGDMTAIMTIKTSHSPTLFWTASPSSNLAYPGALIELSDTFVVKRSDGTTKGTVGFDGLGKCLLHFKQDPIRSSNNAFGDNVPRIVDGHWLRIPKNVDYISHKTAFYMYVEASANGTNESQFFIVPFAWYNLEPVTKTTETPVPYEWLIKHYYYAINTDPNVFESCARQQTGKRDGVGRLLTVADDYLAGTDPRDIESVFKTFISFKNGEPIVTWEPDLNEDGTKEVRIYKTYGCKNLGGTWRDMTTVPEVEKGEFHFFKVTVEMPQIVEVPANVVASQGTSAYAVDLAWDAVDGVTSYEIWRSVSESVTEAEKIATVQGETTYSDSNAIPTKLYYYWIRAVVGNGKMSDFDEPVSGRRKFETVQIIFDSNGGNPTITNNSFLVGSVYGTLPTPQRIGYDFSGWFTERNDGTGVTASTIARETITTLYAHWTPHSYTIHFDANGGDGSMEDQSMTYGTACKLSLNTYLREGWDFEGWAITAGSNEVVYYDAEEVVNVVSIPNAVITLYAVWRISAPTNVSITKLRGLIWDGDGGYAEVRVSWDSVCDATSYEVWRSTSADVSTATRVSTTAGLSFDDALNSTYSSAVTFYFWVRAINNSSTSKFSNRVSWYVEKKVHKW